MNSEYENLVCIIYVVLWGIAGLTASVLNRKAKTIKKKKQIYTIGFMVVALLMLGAAILLQVPALGIGLLVIAGVAVYFLAQKYTFYCPHCLAQTQHLFNSLEHCPRCGEGRNKSEKNKTGKAQPVNAADRERLRGANRGNPEGGR